MATHSCTLAWEIPWTAKLVGFSPRGHRESDTTERLHFPLSTSILRSTARGGGKEGMSSGSLSLMINLVSLNQANSSRTPNLSLHSQDEYTIRY